MRRENNGENIQHTQHASSSETRPATVDQILIIHSNICSKFSASWCWCAYTTSLHRRNGGNVSSHDHMLPSGLWLILQQRVSSTNMFSLCECNQLIFSRPLNDGGAVKLLRWVFQRQWRGPLGGGRGLGEGIGTRLGGADLAISGWRILKGFPWRRQNPALSSV